mmetsp:Transcript_19936/g.64027  ORF Transcript_19936/g.64027 Transcript_19936/m.64027 type:complete len:216 (+) Transcript_19936:376-1023(+)
MSPSTYCWFASWALTPAPSPPAPRSPLISQRSSAPEASEPCSRPTGSSRALASTSPAVSSLRFGHSRSPTEWPHWPHARHCTLLSLTPNGWCWTSLTSSCTPARGASLRSGKRSASLSAGRSTFLRCDASASPGGFWYMKSIDAGGSLFTSPRRAAMSERAWRRDSSIACSRASSFFFSASSRFFSSAFQSFATFCGALGWKLFFPRKLSDMSAA